MCVNTLSHSACRAHAPCYTVICDLSGSTIFFYILFGDLIYQHLTSLLIILPHVLLLNYILVTLPESNVSVPGRGKRFCLLKNVQTACGAHPASCCVGTEHSLCCLKAAGSWSCLRPCSAEMQYVWKYACNASCALQGRLQPQSLGIQCEGILTERHTHERCPFTEVFFACSISLTCSVFVWSN